MQKVFDNLINGNLKDAKKGAKRYHPARLSLYCVEVLGYNWERTFHTVNYLRHGGSFQSYCDAK